MPINITFTNSCKGVDFTLGRNNDGASYTVPSTDTLSTSVSSPLRAGGIQSVSIVENSSVVNPITELVAQALEPPPIPIATASVIWTNYDHNIRFGILATVALGPIGAVGNIIPSQEWEYMFDQSPDQDALWRKPAQQSAPLQDLALGAFRLTIEPQLGEGSVTIVCAISQADQEGDPHG